MTTRETAKQKILRRLALASEPLPVHLLAIPDVSDNAAATRLSELARQGLVVGQFFPGKPYKFWSIPRDGQQVMF